MYETHEDYSWVVKCHQSKKERKKETPADDIVQESVASGTVESEYNEKRSFYLCREIGGRVGGDMSPALPADVYSATEGGSAGGHRGWRPLTSIWRLHPHAATQRKQLRSLQGDVISV